MAQPAPRTRLEQHVQLAHLSIPEFVTRFQAAAVYLRNIGAELICDQARHTIQAGSSFLALGDGEQAEAQTTAATAYRVVRIVSMWRSHRAACSGVPYAL